MEEVLAFIENFTSPIRTVNIPPMIVERDLKRVTTNGYSEFLESIEKPFRLANENEWEYLCGAGTRTLFRWGTKINDNWYNDDDEELYEPNMFGLRIAYYPYFYELINDLNIKAKGGDGGRAMCGGEGAIHSFLPLSPYYRPYDPIRYKSITDGYHYYRRIFDNIKTGVIS